MIIEFVLTFFLLLPFSYSHVFPFCLSADLTPQQFWTNVNCLSETRFEVLHSCQEFCITNCQYVQYHATSSNAKWPKEQRYKTYYDSTISSMSYGWRFRDLGIDCETVNCSLEMRAHRARLVDNNFAKISISLGSFTVTEFEDFEKITFSSFLAQLGGVLNLWSGITVVILLECIDWAAKIWLEKSKRCEEKTKTIKVKESPRSDIQMVKTLKL